MRIRDTFRDWQEEGNVRRDILKLGLLAGLIALAGIAFLFVGFFNVAASTGHWKVTGWLLHTVMRQSVQFHAAGIEPPPLDDRGMVTAGAGHFESGCAPCHGSPAASRNPVVLEMTPHPPDLAKTVPTWEANHLFWIVKHGVKFTGMPAWPALEREDEVWAVVAFLRRLPEMEAAEYERLAHGEAEPPQSIASHAAQEAAAASPAGAGCLRCHGHSGAGSDAFPLLAGQNEDYLFASLRAYADGRRHSGIMQAATSGLDEAAMRRLAQHYAAAEPSRQSASSAGGAGDAARGEEIARQGDPTRGVPACSACHGLAEGPRFAAYPRLAGQQAWYIALQLRLLKAGKRGGTPFAHIMRAVAERLDEQQIDDLAAFYAGLPAAARAEAN